MKMLVRSALALAVICATACGGGSSSTDSIKTTPPAGQFNGAAWTMSKATVTNDGSELSVKLFADPNVADCATSEDSSSTVGYLMWTMPAKVGSRPLQLSLSDFSSPDNQTVTFVTPPSSNNISTDGVLEVTALTDTSVTIGLDVRAGTGNEINGTFTATLCQ